MTVRLANATLVHETLELGTHVLVPVEEIVQLEADLYEAREDVAMLREQLEYLRRTRTQKSQQP